MSEEEDLAVLIYKSSKTAKARTAAAAATAVKEMKQMTASFADVEHLLERDLLLTETRGLL